MADVSDAVLLALFGAMMFPLFPPSLTIDFPDAGFKAGVSAGTISLANSLTSTAPSSLLSLLTISCKPYRSTKIARFGCTSHTVRRIRKRFSRTTALLCELSLSMIRLKNVAFAMPMVIAMEMRQILRKGSRRFSNEFALAETKHFKSISIEDGFISSSSTRAISSCNLRLYISKDGKNNGNNDIP